MRIKNKYIFILIFIFSFLVVSCSTVSNEINIPELQIESAEDNENNTEIGNEINDATGNEEDEAAPKDKASQKPDMETLQQLEGDFGFVDMFPNLDFDRPLDLQTTGDGSGRIFIVEQSGFILVVDSPGTDEKRLFLDISDRVDDSENEMGLLGLAFHPDFENNGYFYLNYTISGATRISRFSIDNNNPDKGNPESESVILSFNQPYRNHNGGQLSFGPEDHYLYIAVGDGGSAADPHGNGQDRSSLLGTILRIDIDNLDEGLEYSIPEDNPFKDNQMGYREEIFAYGLRNPWRFSFDKGNILWAADVGQNEIEEIDIIVKGGNYGWNIMEGSQCFQPPSGCDKQGLELPVYEYGHELGSSITGGFVYRGEKLPALQGVYIYADFVSGTIWGLVYDKSTDTMNFKISETGLNISSFGIDENKELYFTAFDGNIYQLTMP
jgi:glucose/arabinose dehydrogenase